MTNAATIEKGEQGTLLDLDTRELNAYWVDPQQPLQVPTNPLHYAAHKYQLILQRLDIQAAKNPAQFNSGNYIAIMEKLEKLWQDINQRDGIISETHDGGAVDPDGDEETTAGVGERTPLGVVAGVSPDNPFSG